MHTIIIHSMITSWRHHHNMVVAWAHFKNKISYFTLPKYLTWCQEMDQFPVPGPLSFEENVSENRRKWKQRFDIYMVATSKNSKSDEVKAAISFTQQPSKFSMHWNMTTQETKRSWTSYWKSSRLTVSHAKMSLGRYTCSIVKINNQAKP